MFKDNGEYELGLTVNWCKGLSIWTSIFPNSNLRLFKHRILQFITANIIWKNHIQNSLRESMIPWDPCPISTLKMRILMIYVYFEKYLIQIWLNTFFVSFEGHYISFLAITTLVQKNLFFNKWVINLNLLEIWI